MKKDIKGLLILFVVLSIISTIVILSFGREYTTSFIYNGDKNYKLKLENETGKIKIINEKKGNNKYIVKIKAIKPGRAFISLGDNSSGETKIFYVHKSMIITENTVFGKSAYSEVIPISIIVLLIYILYILIKRYKESIKDNLYQYKNIAYLGIIIFIFFFLFSNITSLVRYTGLYDTINRIISSTTAISMFLFPLAFISFILVTISNIRLIRKEGYSLRNILGIILGIFICLSTILPDRVYLFLQRKQIVDIYNLNSMGPYIYSFIETLLYLVIAYLECILIGTIIIAIKSVRKKLEYNKDYIIILGCQIKKDGSLTPLLKGRADKALQFRKEQLDKTGKDLVFIASGGKGNDEVISEGEAIANYLKEQGISKKNILIDDKSTNTYENIKYSNKLVKNKKANIAFSTTNYHVLRAGLIATEQGLKLEGMGSKTKAYFWINAFIREFIGTIYSEKKKHIIMFLIIIPILVLMIYITYVANNM